MHALALSDKDTPNTRDVHTCTHARTRTHASMHAHARARTENTS